MASITLMLSTLALALIGGSSAATPAAHSAAPATYDWPLQPGPDTIARDFDPPPHPWLSGNRGVDLVGRPGEQVHASGPGIVSFAGTIAGVGVVSITSGALRTTYEPLRVSVHPGARVTGGAVIGRLELTGSHCGPQACLHWGLVRDSNYLDPLALLGLERVRLLPVDSSGA